MNFDRLDVHILRELIQARAATVLDPEFRKSLRTISRTLRITEDTVRSRVRRIEQSGFLFDWRIYVNPRILGLHEAVVWFDVPLDLPKNQVIEKLKQVPDLFVVVNYFDSLVLAFFRYDTSASLTEKKQLLEKIANNSVNLGKFIWPEVKLSLRQTDWSVLATLHKDPRKSETEISKEAKVSTRTVERSLSRMSKASAVFSLPSIRPEALSGTILADLGVTYPQEYRGRIHHAVLQHVDDFLWHLLPPFLTSEGFGHTFFELALPNILEASRILEWARRIPGVKYARMDLKQSHEILLDVLDRHLETKLGQMTKIARY